jgi:type IV pilus assembly protein PilW
MRRSRGVTMIELLISLAIGSFVIMGAVFVYSQSRTTYALNEQVARLQENGRYVLAMMEPDIQLAGNYGGTNEPEQIIWDATEVDANQLKPSDAAVGPAAVHTCGNNFGLYLLMPIQGSNNSYGLGCAVAAQAGSAVATADTLTIRRAETEEQAAATATRIQIYTNRLVKSQQRVFWSATAPGPLDNSVNDLYNLTFHSYYVGANSSMRTGLPTLWRKVLGSSGAAPAVLNEEVMPGVEDFQVEFGVDDGDHNGDGAIDNDQNPPIGVADDVNGVISRWVAPSALGLNPFPAGSQWQVVAVRVWVRLRSDTPEPSFKDTKTYDYAGVSYTPTGAEQNFRRLLVSRTIYVRNSRVF